MTNVNSENILFNSQHVLEENEDIIAAILENFQLGRYEDCLQYYIILQRNLINLSIELDNYPGQIDPYSNTIDHFPDEIMRKDVLDDLRPIQNRVLPTASLPHACLECFQKKISDYECRITLNHIELSHTFDENDRDDFIRIAQFIMNEQKMKRSQNVSNKRQYRRWEANEIHSLIFCISIHGYKDISRLSSYFPYRNPNMIKSFITNNFTSEQLNEIVKGNCPNPPSNWTPPPELLELARYSGHSIVAKEEVQAKLSTGNNSWNSLVTLVTNNKIINNNEISSVNNDITKDDYLSKDNLSRNVVQSVTSGIPTTTTSTAPINSTTSMNTNPLYMQLFDPRRNDVYMQPSLAPSSITNLPFNYTVASSVNKTKRYRKEGPYSLSGKRYPKLDSKQQLYNQLLLNQQQQQQIYQQLLYNSSIPSTNLSASSQLPTSAIPTGPMDAAYLQQQYHMQQQMLLLQNRQMMSQSLGMPNILPPVQMMSFPMQSQMQPITQVQSNSNVTSYPSSFTSSNNPPAEKRNNSKRVNNATGVESQVFVERDSSNFQSNKRVKKPKKVTLQEPTSNLISQNEMSSSLLDVNSRNVMLEMDNNVELIEDMNSKISFTDFQENSDQDVSFIPNLYNSATDYSFM